MIKGAVIRESKLDSKQKIQKLNQIKRRRSDYKPIDQNESTFVKVMRPSDTLESTQIPSRARTMIPVKTHNMLGRPS